MGLFINVSLNLCICIFCNAIELNVATACDIFSPAAIEKRSSSCICIFCCSRRAVAADVSETEADGHVCMYVHTSICIYQSVASLSLPCGQCSATIDES